MNKKILFLLLTIIIFSCNNSQKYLKDSFIIEGKITNADKKFILLQKLTYKEIISIDSVVLNKKGIFSFTVKPEEKGIYLLRKDANHYISIIADKGERIIFEADYESFEKFYTIKGSTDSKLLLELNNYLQPNLQKLDSIGTIWKTAMYDVNRAEIKKKLDSCYLKIVANQCKFQLSFINKNSRSLAALIALYLPLNREPILKEETNFAIFEKVSNDLIKALPNNSHAINFAKKIKQRKMIEFENELIQKRVKKNNH